MANINLKDYLKNYDKIEKNNTHVIIIFWRI